MSSVVLSMEKPQESLEQYLSMVAEMMPKGGLAGFVRDNGRLYTPARRPKGLLKKKYGECFKNAFNLAYGDDRYTYVEGYAIHIIPMLHAWCVDAEGRVIDTTWRRPEKCAYYGIPLDLDYVAGVLVKEKVYGLICNPHVVEAMYEDAGKSWLKKGV